jgi:hypothetical protein
LHPALQRCFDDGEALLVLLEQCMTWAGTGVLSTIAAGVPTSLGIIDEAVAAQQKGFIFLQISDSYMGFDKPANPNVDYLRRLKPFSRSIIVESPVTSLRLQRPD